MGTLLIAISLFDVDGLTTALYYLVHSTLTGAALFLIVDLISERRGETLDWLVPANPISQAPILGTLFFLIALGVVGLPPLSGFIGKLMVLDATYETRHVWLIWALVLVASLMMTISFARAGSVVFWKTDGRTTGATWATAAIAPMAAVAVLVTASAALSVFAGPAVEVFHATAVQALDPAGYIDAVLTSQPAAQPTGQ
jgi:multicomponent K+:H+ antiporter subunit D